MSSPNCETVQSPTENNNSWSDNNNEDVRDLSADKNSGPRFRSIAEQQTPQVTPKKEGKSQELTIIKTDNKINGRAHKSNSRKPPRTNTHDGKSPTLKEKTINDYVN